MTTVYEIGTKVSDSSEAAGGLLGGGIYPNFSCTGTGPYAFGRPQFFGG